MRLSSPAKPQAFTLIEIITVLAVVAVVLTILVPVTMRSIDSARNTHCLSNLRQIGSAMLLYAGDHDGAVPDRYRPPDNAVTWQTSLQPYMAMVGEKELRTSFICPSANPRPDKYNTAENRATYGISVFLTNHPDLQRQLALVDGPPILMVVDMPTSNQDDRGPWNDGRTSLADRKAMFRHEGNTRTNGVFTDGHVESMLPSRAGIFGSEVEGSAWVPPGIPNRFAGYWISPTPSQPTDEIR